MNCRFVQSHLSAYIDSELTGFQQQAMRHHLLQCNECRAEHDRLLRVKRALSYLPLRTPSIWFEQRLVYAVQKVQGGTAQVSGSRQSGDSFWVRFGYALAVGLMLFWLAPRERPRYDVPRTSSNLASNLKFLVHHDNNPPVAMPAGHLEFFDYHAPDHTVPILQPVTPIFFTPYGR